MTDIINTADAAKYLKLTERNFLRKYSNNKHKFPTPIRGADINHHVPHAYFWSKSELIAWIEWSNQDSTVQINTSYKDFMQNENNESK